MRWLTALLGGALVGATAIVYTISFFAIVFTGDLAVHMNAWIGPILIGSGVMAILGGLAFSYRGTVMHPQDVPAALFSAAAAQMVVGAPGMTDEALVGTILVMIAVTTVSAGIVTFLLGRARLGYVVHAIPYPVVLGFLAATGVTLVLGAVGMTVERSVTLRSGTEVFAAGLLGDWLPWLLVSAGIFILSQRIRSPLLLPVCIALTLAGFYGIVARGPGLEGVWAAGLMLAEPGGDLSAGQDFSVYGAADWAALAAEIPLIMAIVGLTAIGGLLNLTGLRYVTEGRLDLDRDLRAIGMANIAGGMTGGMVGYPVVSTSYLGWRVGLHGVMAPLAAAVACGAVGLFGLDILAFLPTGLFASIVGYLGLDLIVSSASAARCRLSRTDRLLFAGVVTMAATLGFLEAMALGFVAAVILFAHSAGRVDVVHARHTLATKTSRTERSETDMRTLWHHGKDVVIIELTGYLFFGACSRLRALAEDELSAKDGPPDSIVLDLSRVSGLDASAALALVEFRNSCDATGVRLVVAGARAAVLATLRSVDVEEEARLDSHETLEAALFQIEEALLRRSDNRGWSNDASTLLEALTRTDPAFDPMVRFQPRTAAAGTRILAAGEEANELFILLSGRASATLPSADGVPRVVARFLPGAIIGEIALLSGNPRSAQVTAETECTLLLVDREFIDGADAKSTELPVHFHRLLATTLALRLHRYMAFAAET